MHNLVSYRYFIVEILPNNYIEYIDFFNYKIITKLII